MGSLSTLALTHTPDTVVPVTGSLHGLVTKLLNNPLHPLTLTGRPPSSPPTGQPPPPSPSPSSPSPPPPSPMKEAFARLKVTQKQLDRLLKESKAHKGTVVPWVYRSSHNHEDDTRKGAGPGTDRLQTLAGQRGSRKEESGGRAQERNV